MYTNVVTEIKNALTRNAEDCALALGDFFVDVQLSDEQLRGVSRDVFFARAWEQRRVQRALRRAEVNMWRARAQEQSAPAALQNIARELQAQAAAALRLRAGVIVPGLRSPAGEKGRGGRPAEGRGAGTFPASVLLNIEVGGGRVEVLELRDGDDIDELVVAFVRRHGLPLRTADVLAAEAVKALRECSC